MTKLSSRIKLFASIAIFAVFSGMMFSFGYGVLDSRNQAQLDLVNQKNLELLVLEREQQNFEQGKNDLTSLKEQPYPPEDLFSKDTRVVNEIRELEELASRYSLDFSLQVAGSSATAPKAVGVSADLLQVPYSVTVTGGFNNILKYIEASEHTTFINQGYALQLNAVADGETRAVINSQFYLKP